MRISAHPAMPFVLMAAAAAVSASAGVPDGLAALKENEMVYEGKVVRLVNYEGTLYRRIELDDLRGLAVGDTPLHGLDVCVEGKFDRMSAGGIFRMIGSDRQFAVPEAERGKIAGLMRGDNLWVGGRAQRIQGEASCYVIVRAVVRLGSDDELFRQRFELYRKEGNWKRLVELGRWIEASGEQAAGDRFEDFDRYRVLKDKAYRQALGIREQELGRDDAEGHYQLARSYIELLGRAGRPAAVEKLRRAVAIDPDHAGAAELLRDLGYVKYGARWVTEAERQELERAERPGPAGPPGGETPAAPEAEPAGGRPAIEKLSLVERLRKLAALELQARTGPAGLAAATGGISREDERVARRLVWILANTGGTAGLDGLLRALRSPSSEVRKDVAGALAFLGEVSELAEIVQRDEEVSVREEALGALADCGTREAVDRLVELLGSPDAGLRERVESELARVTGQKHSGAEAWQGWWKANRSAFKGRRGD